jgi:hypothetical protein
MNPRPKMGIFRFLIGVEKAANLGYSKKILGKNL